jgi:SAM-dependent methyltransferase
MLTLDTFRQLQTPPGQAALLAAESLKPTEAMLLRDLATLRKHFAPELASAALETVLLRQRARAKFSRAERMYFTREALMQSSGELVARHRARRYADLAQPIYDLCCSIGGDALELAAAGSTVAGLDIDPLRLAIAEANAAIYDVAERVVFQQADVRDWAVPPNAWIFFDPARRSGERRHWQPADYEPPLSLIERWLGRAAGIGVKVGPGIDYEALPYDCEVELVSVAGEVKEACLWFGRLRRSTRSAVLLPGGQVLQDAPTPPIPVVAPLSYLYEPDGAVIRAHLVEQLAAQLNAAKIDESIAFLTTDSLVDTPFARAFRVLETMPFNLKRLRARLRELDVGQVVIKKRGSPIDPQVLEKQLRLSGSRAATIVLTRVQGQPSALLCQPLAPTSESSS